MSRDDDPSYNDTHRAFLQALMARGTLTYTQAQPILAAIQTAYERREILPADITESDFNHYISVASSAVSAFDYEIRSTRHQNPSTSSSSALASEVGDRNNRVYALINGHSDGLTQLATGFDADELAFVKRVLDAMFETFNTRKREVCAVKGTAALQLCKPRDAERRQSAAVAAPTQNGETQSSASQGITMSQGQTVLGQLVSQGWFELSAMGYYSLSPKALMELRGWLSETYNDVEESEEEQSRGTREKVKSCQACQEIVTIGQRCPKEMCLARLHDICTDRFFRMQKSRTCPLCKSDWEGHGFVGERAAA